MSVLTSINMDYIAEQQDFIRSITGSAPAERKSERGQLKIFLGYAAGVGKTYQMLNEAHELKRAGVDVVIGYFEPHGGKDTMALVEGLEAVPRRVVGYRGSRFEEMGTESILNRRPRVALVAEFRNG